MSRISRAVRFATASRSALLRRGARALWALTVLATAACDEDTPLAVDDSQLPAEPVTVRIQFPWSQFGSNLAVYGGYGRPSDLNAGIIAHAHAGTLEARTLVRFGPYPPSATVTDPEGAVRTDNDLTFFAGYVVIELDTIASTATGPVTLGLGTLLTEWHPRSATWTAAVDTLGDQRAWPEPGAGPVTPVTTTVWSPSDADSAQFFVDSATIASWADQTNPARGIRLGLLTEGPRLHVSSAALRLFARSSINPDTTLVLSAGGAQMTFIYTPDAQPPADQITLGGAPAWRSVLDVVTPTELSGPPELCAVVGCPFALEPQHISYAALRLTSRSPEPAFQPTDSFALDVRAVLSPAALPKSPIGGSFLAQPNGLQIAPELFGAQVGTPIEVPITNFVKSYLADPVGGRAPSTTLALLTAAEPGNFSLASFFGPGVPQEPVLDLVVTVAPPLEIR